MLVLALLFALSIFINGSSFAAIHGGRAMRLDLSGSEVIPFILSYSASGEGHSVRVRKEDYSPELAGCITALIARQAEDRSGS